MNAPYWMKISKQQNKHTFGLNKFQFICVNHLFCVIFSLISSEKEFELGRWGFWRAYEGNPHKSIRTLCARFWQPIFGFAAYLLICIIFFPLLCGICFDICGAEFGFRFWFLLRCYVHIWYGFHVCLDVWLMAHLRLIYEVPFALSQSQLITLSRGYEDGPMHWPGN